MNEQLSMFDLFATPNVGPVPMADAGPVAAMIQASAKQEGGYSIFGIVRREINIRAWRPSAGEVLEMFPLSLSYYMTRNMLDRGGRVRLDVREVDANGALMKDGRAAVVEVDAGALYAAADAAGLF